MSGFSLERGLPADLAAERLVLGCLLTSENYIATLGDLEVRDFSLEKNRRIFARMLEIHERGDHIDRITLAAELDRRRQLESVDGLSYLASLDDGLPATFNLESYVRIVKDKARRRRLILASQTAMNEAMLGEDDTAAVLGRLQQAVTGIDSDSSSGKRELATADEIVEQYPGGINAFLEPSRRPQGLKTGFAKLDDLTGGLHRSNLIVLAARPGAGKTAMALNIADYVACRLGKPAAVFSLEMSREELLTRMLCSRARVDSQKFRLGFLCHEERVRLQVAVSQIAKAPLWIDDTASINLTTIGAKLRKVGQEKSHEWALAIVDYLQLMTAMGRFNNRNEEVSSISRGFKLLAKELGTPMLVLSQLSRATETRPGDKRPQLSDLRESGSIEQDADVVAFIFREEMYKRDREDLRGLAELLLQKQRQGPTGKINLIFLSHLTKFENRVDDLGDEPEERRPYAD